MQTIKITTSQNIDIDYVLADLGTRIVARLVDYGVFMGLYLIIFIILGVFAGLDNYYSGTGLFIGIFVIAGIWLLLYLFYDLVCEIFMNGQSLGKRAMKIKVISLNGVRPTVGQYLLRWFFRIVDFGLTLGSGALICVILSDKKQRIGDMVAGTTVVSLKANVTELVFGEPPADYEPVYNEVTLLTDKDVVLIHDVIRNFNHTRNSSLVYKLAVQLKNYLKVNYPGDINEYQFLEIVLNDYNSLIAKTVA
ncbi:RDD family protein [Mucilaginibacter sp.]